MIRYLALEGIDGAGKDHQLQALARRLERIGVTPIILHEPSYGVHGRALRARLAAFPDDRNAQRRLFDIDREEHWRTKIRPALDFVRSTEGFVVLQNRSILSGAAYQPLGERDDELIDTIRSQELVAPMPEMVVVLDLDAASAMGRIKARPDVHIFENARTLESVRRRYLRLVELLPECVRIDADREPDAVTDDLMAVVMRARMAGD